VAEQVPPLNVVNFSAGPLASARLRQGAFYVTILDSPLVGQAF
jgi:hypothetical protein